jgi:hypothetical protein
MRSVPKVAGHDARSVRSSGASGSGWPAGPLGEGPHPDGDCQPRVHPGRRDRVDPARLPGRRQVPGIQQGAKLVAQGMVGAWNRRLAMLNPDYELLAGPEGVSPVAT